MAVTPSATLVATRTPPPAMKVSWRCRYRQYGKTQLSDLTHLLSTTAAMTRCDQLRDGTEALVGDLAMVMGVDG